MSMPRMFFLGLILLMLGLQFRLVDHYVLNERATEVLEEQLPNNSSSLDLDDYSLFDDIGSTGARRTIYTPDWLGWSCLSAGAVLILTCPIFR